MPRRDASASGEGGRDDRPRAPRRPATSPLATEVFAFVTGRGAKQDDAAFNASMEAFRQELAPANAVERALAGMVIYAAVRLRRAVLVMAIVPPPPNLARYWTDAQRDYWRNFKEFEKFRRSEINPHAVRPSRRKPGPSAIDVAREALGPVVTHPLPEWRSRIDLQRVGATAWPVVKGTSIRAATVLSLIEEGWPAETVQRALPGLTIEDFRACLSCDRAGKAGPVRPWHDPDAFARD